ncbi:MAG: TIGR00730 family Rossman fold protein [Eubacteriales bacterium]|nr:TIGR00730 family Rossman fold protein [Eubacteriales bacterium]
MEQRNICVFASSSQRLEESYYAQAKALGRALAQANAGLVFGGGNLGLMGAVARGAEEKQGRIIGVIPEKLNQPGIAFARCTELIVTDTMHVRKATMEQKSCGFIALPGGFGTLEELLEVITLRQLGYHAHPIVLLEHKGFFEPLIEQFERVFHDGFANDAYRSLYQVTSDPDEAVHMVLQAADVALPDKMQDALGR